MNLANITDLISRLFGMFVRKGHNLLNKKLESLMRLSEDEFKQEFSSSDSYSINEESSLFPFLSKIIKFFAPFDTDLISDLALGIAAFNRCPADLPEGSELYPEQIQAAIVLTQPSILHMDTGEGKTYALLPAAFVLQRKHGRVYILCANDYLAFRDAKRTKNYWDYVGLSVSYCSQETRHRDEKWGSDIIYTTA